MSLSLRDQLQAWIKKEGYVSYNSVKYAVENGLLGRLYRITTAERELRPSHSPMIEAIEKNGYIVGYKYNSENESLSELKEGFYVGENDQNQIFQEDCGLVHKTILLSLF